MSNTLMIEGQIMYDGIKAIDTLKEALEKLSTLKCTMGWDIHPERARAIAYAIWLEKKGLKDMFAHYTKMLEFYAEIEKGEAIDITKFGHLSEAPEGWILPTPYLKGEIPKDKEYTYPNGCIGHPENTDICSSCNPKTEVTPESDKKVVCDACGENIEDGDNVSECPHCSALWCEGCDAFVDGSEWGKDGERCNDCLIAAAESRHDAMYDMG